MKRTMGALRNHEHIDSSGKPAESILPAPANERAIRSDFLTESHISRAVVTFDTRKERFIANRLGILARHRFMLALSTSLLITVLMTVFVGYYAVFAILLGIIVGIGVLLVLSFPPTPQNLAGDSANIAGDSADGQEKKQ